MKVSNTRQNAPGQKMKLRLSLIVAGAALASAFTVPGCPDQDAINAQITSLQTIVDSSAKRNADFANQLKTINDEHNTLKQLMSQVSESALAQKAQIEALQAQVKTLEEKLARAPAPRAMTPSRTAPTRTMTAPKSLPSTLKRRR